MRGNEAMITDPTWSFFLVLAIILLAPLLLRRIRIPHIIALMLAGVLIGPYGLNLIARDRSFEIFGQVGIYYIMFLAALELNMGSVEHYGRRGLQFGLLTFLIPLLMGMASAHYLLGYGIDTSLLLGCVLGSHTLVTYPIVSRFGLGRTPAVIISVVATAVAIFLALLLVAIIVGRLRPDADWTFWLFFVVKCVLYGTFVITVFPRLGRWFLRRFDDNVAQYIFILSLVFLSAALAELAGLEGLLGAFLAGLVINRLIPRTSPLMNRIEFVGNALFIPYFLIGVGMIIDVNILVSDTHTMWIILVVVLTATLSKWLAVEAMHRLSRKTHYGNHMLMFGLTNAHAAGALAIVMIGTDPAVQLMDNSMLNATVMLILFSCIISSLATTRGAQLTALRETQFEENRGSFHGKCLVAYSRENSVAQMTQMAMLIHNPYIPDSIVGLNVSFDDKSGIQDKTGRKLLEHAQEMATAADVPMMILNRVSTNIASGILHTMVENECGEVIVSLVEDATDMPRPSLGPIVESLLEGTYREVMAICCIVPLNTLRRVTVAVPQKAEYEVGFYKWIEHICRIGEQLDCHLEIHAHPDTLPYIQEYMRQKHGHLRTEYHEMHRWTQLVSLASRLGDDDMLVAVSARPGFISHQSVLDRLPFIVRRYFSHTSVMLLYPDQLGDPMDDVSIFAPNGRAVTRQNDWLRRLFNPAINNKDEQ